VVRAAGAAGFAAGDADAEAAAARACGAGASNSGEAWPSSSDNNPARLQRFRSALERLNLLAQFRVLRLFAAQNLMISFMVSPITNLGVRHRWSIPKRVFAITSVM